MRLAANVLLPGTGWVAFKQLIDLVVLEMDLLGKRALPRQSLAFYDFHTMKAVCEATISFSVRRPAFSNTDFEDTLSLRLVLVIVRATDLIERLMFSGVPGVRELGPGLDFGFSGCFPLFKGVFLIVSRHLHFWGFGRLAGWGANRPQI